MRAYWTNEDWAKALSLADGTRSAEEISEAMAGRFTAEQVKDRFQNHGQYARLRKTYEPKAYFAEQAVLQQDLLAEREARQAAADRRTFTQVFFGDPPPGYSALDRKRAAEARA